MWYIVQHFKKIECHIPQWIRKKVSIIIYVWTPFNLVDAFKSREGFLGPKWKISIWLDRVVIQMVSKSFLNPNVRFFWALRGVCMFDLAPTIP